MLTIQPRFILPLVLLATGTSSLSAAPEFDVKNSAEFAKIIPAGAQVEKLAGDMQFTEGPVWCPADGGYLVFSDIPADELKKWTRSAGVTTFRKPSRNINGNTLDREGRLVSAEHTGRQVSVTEPDGTVRTLVASCDGRKFNSPNDVVVKSDGTVWFTDPPYGLRNKADKEQPGNFVFRFDPKAQRASVVARDFDMPNGLCFSPDEQKLYIADSGKPRHIRVFDVQPDGTLAAGKVHCAIDQGGPDGIRCDHGGRVWSSSGNGVQVFAPDGALIVKINLPEGGANLCFGGADARTLFVTARKSLYALPTLVKDGTRR